MKSIINAAPVIWLILAPIAAAMPTASTPSAPTLQNTTIDVLASTNGTTALSAREDDPGVQQDFDNEFWANCTITEKFNFGSRFKIEGRGWDPDKLGWAGKGLLDNLQPCKGIMPVFVWKWWWQVPKEKENGYWRSTGAILTNWEEDCIQNAIAHAGGPETICAVKDETGLMFSI